MKRETAEPASAGIAENRLKNPNKKLRKRLALATMIGALAVTSTAGAEREYAQLEGAGFSSGRVWQEDPVAVQEEYDRFKATKLDTVLMIQPSTHGGDDIENDAERLCNGVRLAHENDIDVVIRNEHYFRAKPNEKKPSKLGYMPTRQSEYQQYITSMYNMFSNLFGENGCSKGADELYLAPYNEPDSALFNRNQVVAGKRVGARNLVKFYSNIYKPLHQMAEEFGIDDFKIIGGEVRQQSVKTFTAEMAEAMHDLKIKSPIFDIWGQHYYLTKADEASQEKAIAHIQKTKSAVSETFGDIPIWYTELGAISKVDSSKSNLYTKLPKHIDPLTQEAQGVFYGEFARRAACQDIGRVIFWQLVDDGSILRTGVYGRDATEKASLAPTAHAIDSLRTTPAEC